MDRKTFILSEIKRTARANGGKPLGWRRFTAETGIESDAWEGRFWARWSDALADAGLNPNTMIARFDDAHLMESYVSLVREYGRPPTTAEIELAHNQTGTPGEKAFRNRFGRKAALVEAAREYCGSQAGFQDVMKALGSAVPAPVGRALAQTGRRPQHFSTGAVYLMKAGRYYKVGRSKSIARRTYELGIQLPQRATVVHQIQTDDPVGIEAYWHGRFAAKRLNGEWFELAPADVAAFKLRQFM